MFNMFKKIPDQLLRLLVLFVALVALVLAARAVIPASLLDSQVHRDSTVEKETSHPVRYAGSDECAACHEEYTLKQTGYHINLSCGTCHGPGREHMEDPGEVKPDVPRKREFCTLCHAYNPSRPTGFPQINPAAHNPLKQCVQCHNPHDPKPPRIPRECGACHAEIARMKSVSPHVLLECTTCHSVPQQHRVVPHTVKSTIPAERLFCGKCHGTESKVRETPKVDMTTHGEKYLCWQCHYPHMPEVE